jgi:hypothetical protein
MIIVLTTATPRDYLDTTLKDVASSARGKRMLVVDCPGTARSGEVETPPGWVSRLGWVSLFVRREEANTQNKFVFWDCLRTAVAAGEDVVFLEDDVRLSLNAARYAEGFIVPDDLAFVTFYCPWGDERVPYGLVKTKVAHFNFCQFMKIPNRTCRELVARSDQMLYSRMGGSDEVVREIGTRLGWSYGLHFPGLAQHIGDFSAVGNRPCPGRVSTAWVGPDFDAMALVGRVDYT